jgi:hypothetical protein
VWKTNVTQAVYQALTVDEELQAPASTMPDATTKRPNAPYAATEATVDHAAATGGCCPAVDTRSEAVATLSSPDHNGTAPLVNHWAAVHDKAATRS